MLFAPGGTIGVRRSGRCLSVIAARPPSTVFSWACSAAVVPNAAAVAMKLRRWDGSAPAVFEWRRV